MKYFYKIIAATLLLLPISMTSFALEQPQTVQAHGSMMGNMSAEQHEQHLKMMQENMLAMHNLSNQILAEKDPAKQEELKKQQRDLMKAHHAGMMGKHGGMK